MLRNARKLRGYILEGRDGDLGSIRDYYFDPTWSIRYLVVETGRWFSSQRVLVSPEAIQKAAWELETFTFGVSKDRLEQAPVFNVLKKVSRQYEMRLRAHFGWSTYWTGESTPPMVPAEAEPETEAPLTTVSDLTGCSIMASDGEVGKVVNVLIDEATWKIRCLVMQTNWILGQHVLLSPQWIESVDLRARKVAVGQTSAVIHQIAPYNPLVAAVPDSVIA